MKEKNRLKTLSKNELENEILSLRKEQFNLRLKKANGQLEKTHSFGQLRRSIARIKTLLAEKQEN